VRPLYSVTFVPHDLCTPWPLYLLIRPRHSINALCQRCYCVRLLVCQSD